MIDPYKIRKDFPMYYKHAGKFKGVDLIYLDNAATTFKPDSVINAETYYYEEITSNAHRGDYALAHEVDVAYENARKTIADFINADVDEVAFTSGDTMAMNQIAFGLADQLHPGDEILLSEAEHASNVLPWFIVAKRTGASIKYVSLDDGKVTLNNLTAALSSHTKIVSLAMISNVLGYKLPVKDIAKLVHANQAILVIDGAQSLPHVKTDVKDLDIDFLAFSAHKMLGPTGIGAMYGKRRLLKTLSPLLYGGEMNARFKADGYISLEESPLKFEAGTQNIAGALGFAAACKYLNQFSFDEIHEHEIKLKKKAVEGLLSNGNAEIYNADADSGIVTFNIKNVFSQDAASYLAAKGVYVRTGQHCAKLTPDILKTDSTIRASFYIYNTEEDVDALVQACKHAEDFLDVFFN